MNTTPSNRWATLDVVKAMTVPAMVVVHNTIWWLSFHPTAIETAMLSWIQVPRVLAFLVMLIPATAGAALFFYYACHKQQPLPAFSIVLKRAGFLIGMGFIMNLFAFGAESIFQWNVLQFFSVSMVIVYVCMRFTNIYLLAFLGVLSVLVSPLVRGITNNLESNYLLSVLVGEPSGAHLWPLLPWFSLVALGFVLSRLMHNTTQRITPLILVVFSLGIGLIVSALYTGSLLFTIDFAYPWGSLVFQPPIMQVLGIIGVTVFLFSSIHMFSSTRTLSRYGVVHVLSYGLFYAYVAHMIIGHRIQEKILSNNPDINLLWLSITLQLVIVYLISIFVVNLRIRRHVH